MTSGDIAAWVQAVGSIVAIAASVAIVVLQNRRDGKNRERVALEDDLKQLEAAFQIVGGAAMNCRQAVGMSKAAILVPDNISRFVAQLSATTDAMSAIDHTRVGGYVAIEAILSSLGASRALLASIRHTLENKFVEFIDAGYLLAACAETEAIIGEKARNLDEQIRLAKARIAHLA